MVIVLKALISLRENPKFYTCQLLATKTFTSLWNDLNFKYMHWFFLYQGIVVFISRVFWANWAPIKLIDLKNKVQKLCKFSEKKSWPVVVQIIVNRGKWLWNSSKFFVVCYCSVFWPWPCTKHNSCLLCAEKLTNRNLLVT